MVGVVQTTASLTVHLTSGNDALTHVCKQMADTLTIEQY